MSIINNIYTNNCIFIQFFLNIYAITRLYYNNIFGNYIPVVPDYLSNAKISFFFKKPKIFAIGKHILIFIAFLLYSQTSTEKA